MVHEAESKTKRAVKRNASSGHNWPRLGTVAAAIAIIAIYLLSVWLSFNEADKRSMALEVAPTSADHLLIHIETTSVDPLRSEITTRISFVLFGKMAAKGFSPRTDLQLVVNGVRGQQQFDFPTGQRINPIEVVFPLEGNANVYPFDHHKGEIWLFLTLPKTKHQTKTVETPPVSAESGLPIASNIPVSKAALEEEVQADTAVKFSASIPGLTFKGTKVIESSEGLKGLTGIEVHIGRSDSVMFISIVAMTMMGALAIGLVVMVMQITSGGRHLSNFHIPMAVSLIFGLPALRNIQPGVPPIGTSGDAIAFIWSEIAAAGSAIALVAHWLLRHSGDQPPPSEND